MNVFNRSNSLAHRHFVKGTTGTDRNSPQNVGLDILRTRFKGAYIGNNKYDFVLATTRHAAGMVDAVAFGRPFISDPSLVARLRNNVPLTPPEPSSFYGVSEEGLTDWPTAA